MKRLVFAALLVVVIAAVPFRGRSEKPLPNLASPVVAVAFQSNSACTPPTQMASSPEQTAWQIFVAATCPVNNNQYPYIVWENWIEQSQLYPGSPSATASKTTPQRFHGSPLTKVTRSRRGGRQALPQGANDNCNKATHPPKDDPNRILCEEVRLNSDSQNYITTNNLQIRSPNGQQQFAQSNTFDFSPPSVEIKADWIQLTSCDSSKLQGVHVEKIDGTCYALAGMHLISKLTTNWLWATFEPQNLWSNPDRCVVLGCNDPYGSNPAQTHGGPNGNTQLTQSLQSLMQQANLAPEWFNYRLDGTQTAFVNSNGKPTLLGNSIIEWENAGVPLTQASCITCHDVSSINKQTGEDGSHLLKSAPVGNPKPLPSSAWVRRDFVWSLALACPDSQFQNCGPSSSGKVTRKKKK